MTEEARVPAQEIDELDEEWRDDPWQLLEETLGGDQKVAASAIGLSVSHLGEYTLAMTLADGREFQLLFGPDDFWFRELEQAP